MGEQVKGGKQQPVLKRYFPHPVLTLVLAAVWILLLNGFGLGGILLGLILGWLVPLFTSAFWPDAPRIRSYGKAVSYFFLVLWDIVVANLQVAYLILFRRSDRLRSRFVTIPLDLRSPEAITVLAGTITMTPGTVSCDLSSDHRSLLVHCLDTGDGAATVQDIKQRYEARLKEIF